MACETCGEKSKKCSCNKDFTRAVVEINNPEVITLLRKVVIPASMGTEEQVPAAIGKYRNVILHYEANGHNYIYSSDGIPTLLEMSIPQELLDKVSELEEDVGDLQEDLGELQQEFDDFKNSPDVVDIVATYADLEAYDTSELGDKDVIRVLADETHDGQSTYYRWDKTNSTWVYIGPAGDYYTKTQTDTLLSGKQNSLTAGNKISIENDTISLIGDSITVLSTDDYDYPTATPDGIALWSLPVGIYKISETVKAYKDTLQTMNMGVNWLLIKYSLQDFIINGFTGGRGQFPRLLVTEPEGAASNEYYVLNSNSMIDNLGSYTTAAPLSANQGRVLNEKITAMGNYSTSETDTGMEWIDGNNIYKKTIYIPALPNATIGHYSIDESNISKIVKLEGFFNSGNSFFPLPYVDAVNYNISVSASLTSIVIDTGTSDYSNRSGYVTVYYTKSS